MLRLALLSVLLSGCGFRLQTTGAAPAVNVSSMSIQLQQTPAYGAFYRTFYAMSKQQGLTIFPNTINKDRLPTGTRLLWLSEPSFTERSLSYSSDGQTNYILIELTLPYKLVDGKGTVVSIGPIVVERPMSIAPNALLNNDSQRALVHNALVQKACIQLMQRLRIDSQSGP